MLLAAYARELETAVRTANPLAASTFSFEERGPHLGVIKGALSFLDGSELHFFEYLGVSDKGIQKLKYRYHYIQGSALCFRYDNSRDPKARAFPTYPHHKHTPKGIAPAESPSLIQVIREAESFVALP